LRSHGAELDSVFKFIRLYRSDPWAWRFSTNNPR